MPSTASAQVSPDQLEEYRRELTGYCYRMLGSGSEADDAVQETMLRAWRAADGFEGRSSVRSWLYRIATNICVDMLPAAPGAADRPGAGLAAGRGAAGRAAPGRHLDLAHRRRAGAARAR
jgi:RNA polymerase sigma-70 factor, ECF subfamily